MDLQNLLSYASARYWLRSNLNALTLLSPPIILTQLMNALNILSITQLKQALAIREKITVLEGRLSEILGGERTALSQYKRRGRRRMSAAARAAIGAAQRARWAKLKVKSAKPRRKMSAAGRAAISAAAKARWKKAKAAGKTRL